MLVAVIMMAFARITHEQEATEEDGNRQAIDDASSTCSLDTATESLASFVASEFAEREPHVAARLRRPEASANAKPSVHTIGLSSAVAVVAA